jgi:hypothetical protein
MAKLGGDGVAFRAREARWRSGAKVNEARRRWAQRKLDEMDSKRAAEKPEPEAPKAKKPKRSKAKAARRSVLAQAADQMMVNQLVSPEAQTHGDYRAVDFKVEDTGKRDKSKEKSIRLVRNVGGSPIERWHSRGALDERQMAAILFYQDAWHRVIGEPRVVANWSAVIVRQAAGAVELYAGSQIAAKEALRLLDQEVFFREPVDHFQVWQNVVIFDEPAGVAGSRVGFVVKKSAEAAARVIVGSMAHKIADIVIDQSKRDFGDLILDLDAPRRPRNRQP